MLNPNERAVYLDDFRPPTGYKLDIAVGTTFSLDLMTLLTIPMAMTRFESEDDAPLRDPIIVMEALRRMSGRFVLFCQQGRIAIPKVDTRLFSYLEPAVVEVQPASKGVFHPKIWVLRFVSEDSVLYRFLCLSRNLTFDKSWDTVLSLEGEPEERKNSISDSRPLADFLLKLPDIARNGISELNRKLVQLAAEEVRRIKWDLPDGFDQYSLWPFGVPGYKRGITFEFSRMMIISPFLSDEQVACLYSHGQDNILISRSESLDGLSNETLMELQKKVKIFSMEDGADNPELIRDEPETDVGSKLKGLHAKLFIWEQGWNCCWLSGSSNATNAGLKGMNVEFMVQLEGKKSKIGINRVLDAEGKGETLASMLVPYQRTQTSSDNNEKLQLENELERIRRAIAAASLFLTVEAHEKGSYDLILNCIGDLPEYQEIIEITCHPLNLDRSRVLDFSSLSQNQPLNFSGLSLLDLTSFLAIRIVASSNNYKLELSFVLNLPIEGLPDHRDQAILHSLVSNKVSFIRYLLMLLHDKDDDSTLYGIEIGRQLGEAKDSSGTVQNLPLLEDMVKAFSRNPEQILAIANLVNELKQLPDGSSVFPEGFSEIWGVFEAACTLEATK